MSLERKDVRFKMDPSWHAVLLSGNVRELTLGEPKPVGD